MKDKSEKAHLPEASDKEEAGKHVESPIEDDTRSEKEDDPPLEEADKDKSNSEGEITESKPELQGKTKEKFPDPSADEKVEIPDDEPPVLLVKALLDLF